MANLRDIRDRIASVKNTQQITRAMKMVAAARLRKAQERMTEARPYSHKLHHIVEKLIERTDSDNKLLREPEKTRRVLLLVMGSDRGLCGGFNNNLFRMVENSLHDHFSDHLEKETLDLFCFGKKANDYFRTRKYPITEHRIGFFENLVFDSITDLGQRFISYFHREKYDRIYLAYNEFKSVIAQKRKIVQLLPVQPGERIMPKEDQPALDTKPAKKTEPEKEVGKKDLTYIDYLYEPDAAAILEHVLPLFINIQLWQASLESFASEQGARMTAMDSATENAGEIIQDLQLKYNQARQAAITTEISEIVSGAEALSE